MARPYDRPATLAALINGLIVLLLPVGLMGALMLWAPTHSNGGTDVVGVDPDRAAALTRKTQFVVGYVTALSPFAMAAAWRTFVHATRWLERGARGGQGVLEGAACGFAGAVFVLLPGILTRPTDAPPYVLAYGGLAAVLGLGFGAILWLSATLVLSRYRLSVAPSPAKDTGVGS